MDICIPDYLRVFCNEDGQWQHIRGESFYNPTGEPPDLEFAIRKYEISREKIATELFRVGGGQAGYYIGDLRHQQFYYCGADACSVKDKMLSLIDSKD
ncbi:hypothetical protein [Anabaena sp. CCY 9910]|uniref:hypothetical protein n=1 Tax=Anabaena sp. CCY 9910 TaxID=3103870 RepID=UPI0039E04B12